MANQYTVKKVEKPKTGKERYLEAKVLMDKGMSRKEAMVKAGIGNATFSYYKTKENPRLKGPVEIPESPSQMIMIVGSPSQIAEAARKFL